MQVTYKNKQINLQKGKNKILVLTSSFPVGSWIPIEKILEELSSYNAEILIVGLSKIDHRNKKFSYFSIPYPSYDKWGHITLNPIIALFWNFPLFLAGIIVLVTFRPRVVISNGFVSALGVAPFLKLFKVRLAVIFNGYFYLGGVSRHITNILCKSVDLVIVNSRGSLENVLQIMPHEKVIINEHHADDLFFEGPIKTRSNRPFTILYVGRIDEGKLCFPLLKIADQLKNNKEFLFLFVGGGRDVDLVKSLEKRSNNAKHLGYVSDRLKLKKLYQTSDLVWSSADETYLGIPAVEALACGTPIVIPKIAALSDKIKKNVEIDKKLVPKKVGWLIDPFNSNEILKLILRIKKSGISKKMRENCREYARMRYSRKNLKRTVKGIHNLMYS